MADFKPITTVASGLPAVVNGNIIATTDTGDLYVDAGGSRIKLTDVITGTYAAITGLIAPLINKLYFATDTHKLLQASYNNGEVVWHELGNSGTSGITWSNVPSSSADTGSPGQIAYDNNYFYVCVAANTWKRATLSTWGASESYSVSGTKLYTISTDSVSGTKLTITTGRGSVSGTKLTLS